VPNPNSDCTSWKPVVVGVGERVEPGLHPQPHVAEQLVGDVGAAGEQREPDEQPRRPLGGDVEHHDEDAEEQQRGAEVAPAHEHREDWRPRPAARPEVTAAGQVEPGEPASGQRQRVALLHEVAGEEGRSAAASRPRWAGRYRPDRDPHAGAVDRPAEAGSAGSSSSPPRPAAARGVGVARERVWSRTTTSTSVKASTPDQRPDQLQRGVGRGSARPALGGALAASKSSRRIITSPSR
jgi:hypothetical protein